MKYCLLLFLFSFTQISIAQQEPDYSNYYFPIAAQKEPQVYVYQNAESGNKEYWKLTALELGGHAVLETKVYLEDFELIEMSTEQVTAEGIEMARMILQFKNSLAETLVSNCLIFENEIFPFSFNDQPSVFEFMTYSNSAVEIWQKTTRSVNDKELKTFKWLGQEKKCLEIIDEIVTGDIDDSNDVLGVESFNRIHLYCAGLGRVSTRSQQDYVFSNMELKEIISLAQFEELKKAAK